MQEVFNDVKTGLDQSREIITKIEKYANGVEKITMIIGEVEKVITKVEGVVTKVEEVFSTVEKTAQTVGGIIETLDKLDKTMKEIGNTPADEHPSNKTTAGLPDTQELPSDTSPPYDSSTSEDVDDEGYELIYLAKYQVKAFIIMLEDEKIELDASNILSIEYLNDYEYNLMALLKVSLSMDIRQKLWILKHKKDIRVKFEMDKIGMDPESEEYNTASMNAWNHDFVAYFNDEDDATDVETREQRLTLNEGEEFNTQDIETDSYFESQNLMDLYLFNPELLKASRTSFNKIYTKTTLQNMVGEMLTSTGHSGVLMSKFENDEVYKELLIPANPVYKGLIYLDQYYGFYEKGALIYYDIDNLFIINSSGKVTAKREGEWTEVSFRVRALNEGSPGGGMLYVEGEEIIYPLITEMDINPQKFSIGKNVELGGEAKIVVTDSVTIDVHEADQSYIDQRNENITYIKEQNKYTGTVIKARMEENECVLYINGNNLDISSFRPNKTFRVIFDETSKQDRYGKNEYRLAYAYHFFKAESGEYMTASHNIILKKTDGPEVENNEE